MLDVFIINFVLSPLHEIRGICTSTREHRAHRFLVDVFQKIQGNGADLQSEEEAFMEFH